MFRSLFLLVLCACSSTESKDDTAGDTGAVSTTVNTNTDTNTTPDVPDWVNPEVPDGPIPPTKGTDTQPEKDDFDWSGIDEERLDEGLPREDINWDEHPQYGTATILDWSDSDECVCFDIDCATCSQDDCSTETCTYDLNDDHTLTKYHVELRATEYTDHAVTFEVNMSAYPAIDYTNIQDVLNRLERVPVEYWYGFKIITEFGHGIQFLHGSYFGGGAAAYGGMNYIDTQTADVPVILHELGHTFEQYTRIGNAPTQEPQDNILNPIWRNAIRSDDIRTSWYGNSNEWEDMAEFALLYAQCLIEDSRGALNARSPERFRIWERVLLNGTTIQP